MHGNNYNITYKLSAYNGQGIILSDLALWSGYNHKTHFAVEKTDVQRV